MKPEILQTLREKLRDLSDDSLAQFFAVVLAEMNTRNPKYKQLLRSPEGPWKKDCDPIRGF